MSKSIPKKVTLTDVFNAIKGIKHDIKFLREDSADMEDHLNTKIQLAEHRLSTKMENQHYELKGMLDSKIPEIEDEVEKLQKIHPQGIHQTVVV